MSSSIYANELKPGHQIIVETHFFPKGKKGSIIHDEDELCFCSERLTVVHVNKNRLKVKDEYGQVTYIPVEDFKLSSMACSGPRTMKHITPPFKGMHFYIWLQ